MTPAQVTAHLLAQATVRYSRASGPGGQHRDHTETRAELVIGLAELAGLPDDVATRLAERLNLTRRPLRLTSQSERSKERNRQTVERALGHRVEAALARRTPRRATTPSKAAVARRLDQKAHRSRTKSLRRQPPAE